MKADAMFGVAVNIREGMKHLTTQTMPKILKKILHSVRNSPAVYLWTIGKLHPGVLVDSVRLSMDFCASFPLCDVLDVGFLFFHLYTHKSKAKAPGSTAPSPL